MEMENENGEWKWIGNMENKRNKGKNEKNELNELKNFIVYNY